jgi:uncharacterized Rmd1/YagE family protein
MKLAISYALAQSTKLSVVSHLPVQGNCSHIHASEKCLTKSVP